MKNRIIKFRAWDNYKKKMFAPSHIDSFGAVVIQEAHEEGCRHCGGTIRGTHPIDLDATLLQFTGTLDRNGKEIYEGDIIRIVLEATAFPNQGNAEVKWDGNGWWVFNDNSQKTWYKGENVEVIGNVFENPELIEPPLVN